MQASLTDLERSFLSACGALVAAERELVPLLADTLGVPPQEVFYSWMDRHFPNVAEEGRLQVGQVQRTPWKYFFHGLECDLRHREDGRYVRVEFGPHGRFDLLTEYAVLQFVMTSRLPWPELPDLKAHLAEKAPPYNQYSGSFQKATELWTRLEAHGLLEAADPDLQALVESRTSQLPNGNFQISLPEEFTYRQHLDCLVSARQVLTPAAFDLLTAGRRS